MAAAARVGDASNHGGTIAGPGVLNVRIGGQTAAVAGDIHVCGLPPNSHQPTTSAFPSGSTSVHIGGRAALRTSDTCACGAAPALGAPNVTIGG